MKTGLFHSLRAVLAVSLSALAADAALPIRDQQPFRDMHAGLETRKFRFSLNSDGLGNLSPINDKGKEAGQALTIRLEFVIQETMPDGKVIPRKIARDSLETESKPFVKQGKTNFKAKTTNGIAFEATVELAQGSMIFGGRLLDPGKSKNPVRFGARATFPNPYRSTAKTSKAEIAKFENKIKDDRFMVVWTDGKRAKFKAADKLDPPESKAVNGPGIAEFRAETAAYQGRAFNFKASPGSAMRLAAPAVQPFYEGFSVMWFPDPAKDKDGKAVFTVEVR